MCGGSDLSQVGLAVLGPGVVPGHLSPFELDELPAVWTGQVVPALIATEEALPDPVNYYGQTKLEGEELIKRSTLKWAIARTVLVYGLANDLSRSNIILWVKSSLEAGKQIQVVDDQVRTPTLAEDLAAGCILIAEQGATGVFNISGAELLTPYDMAMQTADYFGLNKELIVRTDSTRFTQPARRPMRTGFVIQKAMDQLGYRPKTFRMGIELLAKQITLASS